MRTYTTDIVGRKVEMPVYQIGENLSIAFFNLHGAQELTEFCGKEIADRIRDKNPDVVLTAESKGLQLAHVVARNLGQDFYAVARKNKKLYMQDGISTETQSITTAGEQKLYLSQHDVNLIAGKKVAIVDDVISSGGSLASLEKLVNIAGGEVVCKAFVLAEGNAKDRKDVIYLGTIPLL